MVLDVSKISGIGEYTVKSEKDRDIYYKGKMAFLVLHRNTIEIRCDAKLSALLKEKYESVMESRYYGHGGIDIVLLIYSLFARSFFVGLLFACSLCFDCIAFLIKAIHRLNNHKDHARNNQKFDYILDKIAISNHCFIASYKEIWNPNGESSKIYATN